MPNDLAMPIAFPDYQARSDEIQQNVPSGHAGILIVNGSSGLALYFEYGRYDPPANIGLVRQQTIPNIQPGSLSVRSLKPVLRRLSQSSGHGGWLKAAWIEIPQGGFGLMRAYAEHRMQLNRDAARPRYEITSNNCCTFARDVANAGGASVGMSPGIAAAMLQGTIFPHIAELGGVLALTMSSPIPRAFLEQLYMSYPGVEFLPPDTWRRAGRGDLAM